jgi:sugar lactone lactonase YvrE
MDFTATPISGTSSIHGEGALWDVRSQTLFWVDIDGCRVKRYNPATGHAYEWDTKSPCGTVVRRAKGRDEVVAALGDGIAALDLETRKITYLAKVDLPQSRFNDGKCDPAGRLWAGTMFRAGVEGTAVLYRLDADHALRTMVTGLSISNGIVWTRDRKTMYYTDTPTAYVDAFDYDDATGAVTNRRAAFRVDPATLGRPDGIAIDADDRLWIAMWGGSRVCCMDPKTGAVMHTVRCPGSLNTSSCAFGGPELDELFVTTSTQGMSPEQRAAYPHSGQLFRVKLPVRGVPSYEFAG